MLRSLTAAIPGSFAFTIHRHRDAKAISILTNETADVTSWVKSFPLDHGVRAFHAMLRAERDDIKAVLQMPV